MKIEGRCLLEGLWKQYKVKKIHFNSKALQDGRTFEKGMKTAKFARRLLPDAPLHPSHVPMHMKQHWLLRHVP